MSVWTENIVLKYKYRTGFL